MSRVHVVAYAKVNLSLDVIGRRPDGFHEVRSVIQSIGIADDVWLRDAPRVTIECDAPDLEVEDNLALKAVRLLAETHGLDPGVAVRLRKGIPVASGLGGASSDAAAVLLGFAMLRRAALSEPELLLAASRLGSDVPFFLKGGTAMVSGRGEIVQPLPDLRPCWMVLLVPPHSVEGKTAVLYRMLSRESWSGGERTERLARAILEGRCVQPEMLGNTFEGVAQVAFPSLPGHREAMVSSGCPAVHLSGAGPCLFSLFDSESSARAVADRLTSSGFRPHVARSLTAVEAQPRPVVVD